MPGELRTVIGKYFASQHDNRDAVRGVGVDVDLSGPGEPSRHVEQEDQGRQDAHHVAG